MYVYDFNAILTTTMNNRSDKEMIRAFISLTEDLKIRGIHPGFHLIDNKVSTALKLTMATMNIKCQLVLPSNHRANNVDRSIQKFKNHLTGGTCRVEKYFHRQLWDRLLQQATIILKLLRQSITLPHISDYTHIFG